MASSLVTLVRRELRLVAEPASAAAMQAYMKSTMPYHGVSAVPLRALCRRLFAEHPLPHAAAWQRDVLTLWREARFREERYVALELSGHKRARAFQTMDALPMYEEMIVTGAWWDLVDGIAVHRLGVLLEAYPRAMTKAMLGWSKDQDLWKRRSAILCQVARKGSTDLALLYRAIAPSLARKEFFLRKAIGWALRAYAWIDPAEVVRYVREHDEELSGLSKREALKNVLSPKGERAKRLARKARPR
jgi:3-methyladenine DNA glycosylase AlkD